MKPNRLRKPVINEKKTKKTLRQNSYVFISVLRIQNMAGSRKAIAFAETAPIMTNTFLTSSVTVASNTITACRLTHTNYQATGEYPNLLLAIFERLSSSIRFLEGLKFFPRFLHSKIYYFSMIISVNSWFLASMYIKGQLAAHESPNRRITISRQGRGIKSKFLSMLSFVSSPKLNYPTMATVPQSTTWEVVAQIVVQTIFLSSALRRCLKSDQKLKWNVKTTKRVGSVEKDSGNSKLFGRMFRLLCMSELKKSYIQDPSVAQTKAIMLAALMTPIIVTQDMCFMNISGSRTAPQIIDQNFLFIQNWPVSVLIFTRNWFITSPNMLSRMTEQPMLLTSRMILTMNSPTPPQQSFAMLAQLLFLLRFLTLSSRMHESVERKKTSRKKKSPSSTPNSFTNEGSTITPLSMQEFIRLSTVEIVEDLGCSRFSFGSISPSSFERYCTGISLSSSVSSWWQTFMLLSKLLFYWGGTSQGYSRVFMRPSVARRIAGLCLDSVLSGYWSSIFQGAKLFVQLLKLERL